MRPAIEDPKAPHVRAAIGTGEELWVIMFRQPYRLARCWIAKYFSK